MLRWRRWTDSVDQREAVWHSLRVAFFRAMWLGRSSWPTTSQGLAIVRRARVLILVLVNAARLHSPTVPSHARDRSSMEDQFVRNLRGDAALTFAATQKISSSAIFGATLL
jgi:hypothetical protein